MVNKGKHTRGQRFYIWHLSFLVILAFPVSALLADDCPCNAESTIAPDGTRLLYKPYAPILSQATENIEYPVELIPQPDKNSCWAAAMAMLLSFRRSQSCTPGSLAEEVGVSLMTSYSWELLEAVRDHYGFIAIDVPPNSSLYFSPAEWIKWLREFGPLWVVIVGAPHAVVVSGLRGNPEDPASCQVKVLDPWDSRVAFDDDPIEFHPANHGHAEWLPFEQFASDFGDIAKFDKSLTYEGNWRVLWLPDKKPSAIEVDLPGSRSLTPCGRLSWRVADFQVEAWPQVSTI